MINELAQWLIILVLVYAKVKSLRITKEYSTSFWGKKAYRFQINRWISEGNGVSRSKLILCIKWNERLDDDIKDRSDIITLMPFSIKHFSVKLGKF